MKLSTKGRYGLKLMVELGANSTDRQISLSYISEHLGISESYLEQLIAKLKKENLVISKRGSQGGYLLAKNPKDITVGNVLRALEGSLAPTKCTGEGTYDCSLQCGCGGKCVTKSVWEKMRDGINNVVDSISLQELIDDYNEGKLEVI
ncbi:Rrf2 family transcriptional regulator [Candidatus Epulonipiscium fishelsonii]|uniref:Rrf2 family transcriptional regulator n=1 Tax=Candidatus Epulonipiscium fishelsonii TaxID=77094 RepID=A0ACC8XAE2_9FIRM|nr:Rrf2 family transcriptional regulator [Epulopiscium sp. SCG-B11WGA-EpuloA1]ONI43515.1 Rrf2 family transcriptional regulator [Epulopiscium sp. SCG-B05WGA-EpuloA1]